VFATLQATLESRIQPAEELVAVVRDDELGEFRQRVEVIEYVRRIELICLVENDDDRIAVVRFESRDEFVVRRRPAVNVRCQPKFVEIFDRTRGTACDSASSSGESIVLLARRL